MEHKSHVAQWTMDTISVPEKHASKIAKEISAALDPDHGWYADFKMTATTTLYSTARYFTWTERAKVSTSEQLPMAFH